MLELDAGIRGCETPVDLATLLVALWLPALNFPTERGLIGQAPLETSPGQHAQLDLGHVRPTAVLGCVVDLLQAIRQPFGLLGRKGFVQGGGRVGV